MAACHRGRRRTRFVVATVSGVRLRGRDGGRSDSNREHRQAQQSAVIGDPAAGRVGFSELVVHQFMGNDVDVLAVRSKECTRVVADVADTSEAIYF